MLVETLDNERKIMKKYAGEIVEAIEFDGTFERAVQIVGLFEAGVKRVAYDTEGLTFLTNDDAEYIISTQEYLVFSEDAIEVIDPELFEDTYPNEAGDKYVVVSFDDYFAKKMDFDEVVDFLSSMDWDNEADNIESVELFKRGDQSGYVFGDIHILKAGI